MWKHNCWRRWGGPASPHLYTLRAIVRGTHANWSSFGGRRIPQNYLVWEILKIDSRLYKPTPSSHFLKTADRVPCKREIRIPCTYSCHTNSHTAWWGWDIYSDTAYPVIKQGCRVRRIYYQIRRFQASSRNFSCPRRRGEKEVGKKLAEWVVEYYDLRTL